MKERAEWSERIKVLREWKIWTNEKDERPKKLWHCESKESNEWKMERTERTAMHKWRERNEKMKDLKEGNMWKSLINEGVGRTKEMKRLKYYEIIKPMKERIKESNERNK